MKKYRFTFGLWLCFESYAKEGERGVFLLKDGTLLNTNADVNLGAVSCKS